MARASGLGNYAAVQRRVAGAAGQAGNRPSRRVAPPAGEPRVWPLL